MAHSLGQSWPSLIVQRMIEDKRRKEKSRGGKRRGEGSGGEGR